MHEGTNQAVGELVSFIHNYCSEFNSLVALDSYLVSLNESRWSPPLVGLIKVNIDVGFLIAQQKADWEL